MLPQDSGHIIINKFTRGCIINQIKEVTIQIVCFYYDGAVGKIGSLKKIPQRILKHFDNFVFCGVFLYTFRLQSKAFSACGHWCIRLFCQHLCTRLRNLKLSASGVGTALYNLNKNLPETKTPKTNWFYSIQNAKLHRFHKPCMPPAEPCLVQQYYMYPCIMSVDTVSLKGFSTGAV